MPRFAELRISFAERKLLRWIFFFYCLFILYGSFIPFRFSDDPEFVRSQFVRFFAPPYDHGVRRFSLPDVVSNVLLFVPFGLLWVGGEFSLRLQSRFWRAAFTTGLLGLLSGLVIESGQMFSPGRIASILDALCNGIGSATGAAAGYLLFRAFRGSFGLILLQLLRERPSLVLLAMLLIVSMADAYYPFDVTLDVSTVWQNVKNTRLIPFVGMRRFWLDLLVEKTLLYAAIGYLALRNLPAGTARNPKLAWLACSTIALIIEAGKLFCAGRSPNIDSVLFSSLGALVGVVLVPPLATTGIARRHAREILVILVLCIVAYVELSPFDWIRAADEIPLRIAKIEWLPFSSYYSAEPQAALFDLAKKLLLLGSLGFLIAQGSRNRSPGRREALAAGAGLLVGLILEAGQIGLESRNPSLTDVLLFGRAAWAGAVAFERYRRIVDIRL